jgi:hypothetical protein
MMMTDDEFEKRLADADSRGEETSLETLMRDDKPQRGPNGDLWRMRMPVGAIAIFADGSAWYCDYDREGGVKIWEQV